MKASDVHPMLSSIKRIRLSAISLLRRVPRPGQVLLLLGLVLIAWQVAACWAQGQIEPSRSPALPPPGVGTQPVTATATLAPEEETMVPPVEPGIEGTPTPMVYHTPTPSGPTPTPLFAGDLPPDIVNIVLLGEDRRKNSPTWRTDTILLVSIDRWNRTIALLSIPRDLWVYIPGIGYGRINTADFWGTYRKVKGGGPALVKRTIEHNLGIPVHRYAKVNFQGFIKIIDTLGGIDVYVDCAIKDWKTGFSISAGPHHMDGKTALMYARSRYTTSDFDRARRQQQVLRAIFDRALTLGLIPQIPHLWSVLRDTVETDLSLVEMLTLAYFGTHVKRENIRSRVLSWPVVRSWTSPRGEAVLLLDQKRLRKVLDELHKPPEDNPVLPDEPATVEVLNGTPKKTTAELAAGYLKDKGFDVVGVGSADRTNYRNTAIILVNPEKVKTASRLARTLGVDPEHITRFADPTAKADIRVIIGANYRPCKR